MSLALLTIFGFIQLAIFSSLAQPASAQTNNSLFDNQIGVNEISQVYGNKKTDVRVIVAKLIVVVLGFLAAIFLALTVYAGFRYMTAAGNEDQVKKAIAQIRDSVIGLLIVLASWALTYFILRVLSRAVNNQVMIF